MKVMYLGHRRNLYNVALYTRKRGFELKTVTGESIRLSDMKEEILAFEPELVFADILSFAEPEDEICEILEAVKLALNCRAAVIAAGRSMENKMVRSFAAAGFKYFVLSESLGRQMKEIEKVFAGEQSLTDEAAEEITAAREEKVQKVFSQVPESEAAAAVTDKKKIAAVGTMGRIGTTTACLQMVKHLMQQGKKACYIERNQTGFTEQLASCFDGVSLAGDKVCYQNTDLYMAGGINAAISEDYEYYIYDYGSLQTADIMSILEKDAIVIVCGSSPSEIAALTECYRLMYKYDEPFYLFNLTHQSERTEILSLQSGKKDRTVFMEYCPDPFLYSSDNAGAFDLILQGSKVKKTEVKRKRGFFR